jgi:hypothetical protein
MIGDLARCFFLSGLIVGFIAGFLLGGLGP